MIGVLTLCEEGDEIVAARNLYGGTYTQFDVTLRRMGIDVVFVDSQLAVVGIAAALPPWRAAVERRAFAVLELAAGECERRCVAVGDVLLVRATSEPGRPFPPP